MGSEATPPPEVVCSGLAKTFASGTAAVAPLDLTFAAGQTTALVGPSGCGKSTVLRLVAGLEAPSAGRVEIGGGPPAETLRNAGLSVAFQDPSLLPWRSVRGNIELALGLARRPVRTQDIDQLITLVGLEGFADVRPAELSGGHAPARRDRESNSPRDRGFCLLDEPFGAVDELTRQQLAEDLPRIWEARGTTTLLVTHSVREAVMLADRVIVLSPRPARVIADIAVDLPRPREAGLASDAGFVCLTDEVFAALTLGMAAGRTSLAAQ